MSDSQIRIAIAGAGGRMGRQLIRAVQQAEGVVLGAALSRPGSSRSASTPANWRASARWASR